MNDISWLKTMTTMPYEEFKKKGESFLDQFTAVREFFDTVVAASALLGRQTEYYAERTLKKNDTGAWNSNTFTKAFMTEGYISYEYRLALVERPTEIDSDNVTNMIAFFLDDKDEYGIQEMVLVTDCQDLQPGGDNQQQFDYMFEHAEEILERNNLILDLKTIGTPADDINSESSTVSDDDDDDAYSSIKRLKISALVPPAATVEDIIDVYMEQRYIQEPELKDGFLGGIV